MIIVSAEPIQVASHRNHHRDSLRSHIHKHSSEHKPTRVRTVLNEKQLQTLRNCYNQNPRPDALMKEQLVEMTGLSPRVIRVWFQNKRCKDKKRSILMKQIQQQEKVSFLPLLTSLCISSFPIFLISLHLSISVQHTSSHLLLEHPLHRHHGSFLSSNSNYRLSKEPISQSRRSLFKATIILTGREWNGSNGLTERVNEWLDEKNGKLERKRGLKFTDRVLK